MTFSRTIAASVSLAFGLAAAAAAQGQALGRLAWMAGTWTGEANGVQMEEHWTEPRGGLMLGLHRDVARGKAVFFEFLRIEETAAGIVYLASPKGAPATPFPAVEIGDARIVFENPKHDFPTRIVYRLTPDGSLNARVEGTKRGEPASQEWTWRRAR